MKRSKKPERRVAPSLAQFTAALARELGSNMSPCSIKWQLMGLGHPEEEALQLAEALRHVLVQFRKVDYEARLVITISHMDRLYEVLMRDGDRRAAFEVLREQSKLLGLAAHVQPLPEHERTRRPQTDFEDAMADLSPVDRERLRAEIRKTVYERAGRLPNGSKRAPSGPPVVKPESELATPA